MNTRLPRSPSSPSSCSASTRPVTLNPFQARASTVSLSPTSSTAHRRATAVGFWQRRGGLVSRILRWSCGASQSHCKPLRRMLQPRTARCSGARCSSLRPPAFGRRKVGKVPRLVPKVAGGLEQGAPAPLLGLTAFGPSSQGRYGPLLQSPHYGGRAARIPSRMWRCI